MDDCSCATTGALMTLCQKFISSRRVQSKRAVLQEVKLIDSYSCSCPVLVMRLCTCCKPANGFCIILCLFVCVRAAFAFAFVNAREKANAWVLDYYVPYRFTEIGLINIIGCQSVQMFEWFLFLYRFCALCQYKRKSKKYSGKVAGCYTV